MSKDRDQDSDKLDPDHDRIDFRTLYSVLGKRSRSASTTIAVRKPKPASERKRPAFSLDKPRQPKLPESRVQFQTKGGSPRSLIDLTYEVMCEDIGRDVDTIHAILEANGYQTSAPTISSITQDLRRAIRAAERVGFVKVLDPRWDEQKP